MYAEFYGLKELPFALTPDPRFIYFTPSHTEVMANLHYGIESGKGLVVVTGEVGTGKTTILRWMMQRLDRTVLVAYIFNPRLVGSGVLPARRDFARRAEVGNEVGVVARVRPSVGIASLARSANGADHRRSAGTFSARARRDSTALKF